MKMPAYSEIAMTSDTKLLGYESTDPQSTHVYGTTGVFVPFIPSNAKQFIGLITQSGTVVGPSLIPMTGTTNQIGDIVDSVRDSEGNFTLEFEPGTFEFGTLYAIPGPSSPGTPPKILQIGIDPSDLTDSKLLITNYSTLTAGTVDGINVTLHLILV